MALAASACASSGRAPREGFVHADDGVRLHYRVIGRGRPTVVVPNGSQMSELEALAGSFRVVLYDARSRGRSDAAGAAEVSAARDVRDLEALRAALGLERVALLGASYFGALVALYAMDHPERVERVVMVSPLPARSDDFGAVEDPANPTLDELRRQGIDRSEPARFCREYYRSDAPQLFHDPAAFNMDLSFCELPNEWPDRFEAWAGRIFSSLGAWDWSGRAAGLRMPVLVVQGGSDRIVPPAASRRWAGAIPDARLLTIPEAGHLPWLERPERFHPAVEAFLGGEWPEGVEEVEPGP